MNGHRLTPTDNIKYLGVYLDSTLSGDQHCKILSNKLKRANGMLSKVRHYVNAGELKAIYHAIFSSHMIYGCQIWGQGKGTHIDKIYKLQDRALRIINFKDFRADPSPLYIQQNVVKLHDYIRLQNCLFVHSYLNDSLPDCFDDYYFKLNSLYFNVQTRNSNLGCLFKPSIRTSRYGLCSLTQKSINCWNSITKSLKKDLSNMSHHTLKKMLTEYFIGNYR